MNEVTTFMDSQFLLTTETAKYLYENHGKKMPIFDYHSHLPAKEIYEDLKYNHISEAWLGYDHYKWRAMRSYGIDEDMITGNGSLDDKFRAYAETVQNCIGNPLYHWTHLELNKYFDYKEALSPKTADQCLEVCNNQLTKGGLSVREMIKKSNVALIGTTDDPTDDLVYHKLLKDEEDIEVRVVPTFRPDMGINIDKDDFLPWIDKLSNLVGYPVENLKSLMKALNERADFFDETGCLSADHGMDYIPYMIMSEDEVDKIMRKALNGESLEGYEVDAYKTYLIKELAGIYVRKNWVMQLHMGTMRNNNSKMFRQIGKDSGFDSVNDHEIAENLSGLLDDIQEKSGLPKTILYALNPKDNYVLGTMIGNYQEGMKGKFQLGSGWWFNDHKDGMRRQVTDLANLGVLSTFVGMLTDSRSFLSFTRHDYFRRILCQLLGEWVEGGEYPRDLEFLGKVVEDISFNNANKYFTK